MQRSQRIVRAATGSEPIREAKEVHLVDGTQHLGHRTLDNFVLQCGNTDRSRASIWLREMHPANGLRPVASGVDSFAQAPEIALQIKLVALDRLPIDSRARTSLLSPKGSLESRFVHVVQQRREPATPVSLRDLVHPLEGWQQDSPALGPDPGFLPRAPFKPTPSLHRLRG